MRGSRGAERRELSGRWAGRANVVVRRASRGAVPLLLAILALHPAAAQDPYAALRRSMVEEQIRQRGISQPEVLSAMEQVPRHLFVPETMREQAYRDQALSVGSGRTIYQPYIVAYMTSLLALKPGDRVLEIGTGSGYHTAVLSRIAKEVYTIEIVDGIASSAKRRLQELGYRNVQARTGDGYKGWPDKAPFDAILLTAAPPSIPKTLVDQLAVGGRMVVPVGSGAFQDLMVISKTREGIAKRTVIPVRVSPMTGPGHGGD